MPRSQNAPEATFGRVAGFLGLRPSAERQRRAIDYSAFDALREQEAQRGFRERSLKSERFFREGVSGAWRTVLTQAQVDRIVAACGEQMARFGYLPDPG